ncbi:DNA-binding transcriptional regulator FrlR [Roseivivax jejudonensis]|uniref:DNA-binding transcriptional regulator FrlR n=1 Tax=Roseivivax jejudonensis TaxID=1529041 RepID=A0A1X6Y5N8_9RHOB|nr:GntR family transcriptional regulator [Roseivivax jejudonensis]SLN09850.1 DNA-binding transcriptional regulator FrlR [Roseivivax jejudonensis]
MDDSRDFDGRRQTPRYAAIEVALTGAIGDGRLPAGTVVSEDPVARIFGVSRTPARKALAELVAKGRLVRFDGRGFLVAGADADAAPQRITLTAHMLGAEDDRLGAAPRAGAERIAQDFEATIAGALPFGRFRINEVGAAEHYNVSRTIIRELLQRHQDRGLLRKDRRSHWVLGPLTARDIAHYFAIRQRLEPLALEDSAPRLPPGTIVQMLDDTEAALAAGGDTLTSEQVEKLEHDIHRRLLQETPNSQLLRFIEQSQIALTVNAVFSNVIGGRPFEPALREHLFVLGFLRRGSIEAAARALDEHLRLSAARTQKRLMAISVFPPPDLPDYLMRESRFND